MADLDIIAPRIATKITFSIEPAHNVLCSLILISSDISGVSEWIQQTASQLSPEQIRNNGILCGSALSYLEGVAWPSFEAFLDHLVEQDPYVMRNRELDSLVNKVANYLDEEVSHLPTPEELLADRGMYLSLIERIYKHKGSSFDRAEYEMNHELLNDPVERKDLMISHMGMMWSEYMAPEWKGNLQMLQESVDSFTSLDFVGMSTTEIVRKVTARDILPYEWGSWLEDIEEVIFIPSAHIGPYLLLIDHNEKTARIIFGARVPKGVSVSSSSLHRSELLMRLNALADDTRLHILELIAEEGELGAKEIIDHLNLSQSSASRHLRQLSATGYLIEKRREGAKVYRLNRDRIKNTVRSIERFVD